MQINIGVPSHEKIDKQIGVSLRDGIITHSVMASWTRSK